MIAENDIGQLKAQLDIVAVARELGLELKPKGSDFFGLCPFHEDRDASLSVNPPKGLYHCFGCGAKGNAIQLWQEIRGVGFPQAFDELSKRYSVSAEPESSPVNPAAIPATTSATATSPTPTPTPTTTPDQTDQTEKTVDYLLLNSVWQSFVRHFAENQMAQQYLRGVRGLGKLDLTDLVGYCPEHFADLLSKSKRDQLIAAGLLHESGKPRFAKCVVFALRDAMGRVVAFYGRKIEGRGSHYYLPGERSGVFGICEMPRDRRVILCEGAIDALSVYYCGFSNVLSLHGTSGWSEEHLQWLKDRSFYEVILLLDSDAAGERSQKKLALTLEGLGFTVHSLSMIHGADPNSYFCRYGQDQAREMLLELMQKAGVKGFGMDCDAQNGAQIGLMSHAENAVQSSPSDGTSGVASSVSPVSSASDSSSATPANTDSLRVSGDVLLWNDDRIEISITGLSLTHIDRLKVTLRISLLRAPDVFHIDSLDLYSARQRKNLVCDASTQLGLEQDTVHDLIMELVKTLEDYRQQLRSQEGSESQKVSLSEAEKTEALSALKDPNLIDNLLHDFAVCGAVGEEKAKLLGYIGTISRFLEKPLGVLIISRSGAGKTTLQESFCNFVPEEDLRQYTRLSAQSLFYSQNGGLKHKVLAIEEEEGAAPATYSIRTLQSSQRLKASTTRTDPKTGRMISEDYSVEGPVFIVISTTNPDALDYETKNRFVILTVDESEQQTEKILAATRESYTLEGLRLKSQKDAVLKRCRNMQRLLRPLEVVNPYAVVLGYPANRLQMRREFKKYMSLINCIALLHQYQRPIRTHKDFGDYIEVLPSDIALANELVQEFFSLSVDELAPHTRRLAMEINGLIRHKEGECVFSRKELRDFSGWSDWHIRKGLEQLEEMEYIRRISGKNGSAIRYELLVDASDEEVFSMELTKAEDLDGLLAKYRGCA